MIKTISKNKMRSGLLLIKSASLLLGFLFISIGLFSLLYLVMIFGDTISPTLGVLTEAEARVECELMETNSRWAYDGGFHDCVDHYTADELLMKQIAYKFLPLGLSGTFTLLFLFGGALLSYFSDAKNHQEPPSSFWATNLF